MLVETLILVCCQIVVIWLGFLKLTSSDLKLARQLMISLILLMISAPAAEEALFRVVYKSYFGTSTLSRIINGVLFGCYHLQNFSVIYELKMLFLQVIATGYLGYYLYQFPNWLLCFEIHLAYNLINISLVALLVYLFPKKPALVSLNLSSDFGAKIAVPLRTVDDLDYPSRTYRYRYLPKSKFNTKILTEVYQVFDEKIPFAMKIKFIEATFV